MISDAKPGNWQRRKSGGNIKRGFVSRRTETLRWLCVLLYPVMPEATENLRANRFERRHFKNKSRKFKIRRIKSGNEIGETQAVFPRLDKTKIMNEINEQKAIDGAQNIVQETGKN
jgi:methionyl-tRNA synthetase